MSTVMSKDTMNRWIRLLTLLALLSVLLPGAAEAQEPWASMIAQVINQHPVVRESKARLLGVRVEEEVVIIDLSREILPDGRFDAAVFGQLTQALDEQLQLQQTYMLTFKVEGKTLNHWGMPVPDAGVVSPAAPVSPRSGPLAGKKIALNPGHGLYEAAQGDWRWQRGWWWGIIEDLVNAEIQMYVAQYLSNAGATVITLRQFDKNPLGSSGEPQWYEGAREYLRIRGAPGEVWDTPGCGDNMCKDIMARPYGANYYGADLLVNLHNNGSVNHQATGTLTLYDTTGDYHDVSAARNLAQKIHTRVVDAIRSRYNDGWYDFGARGSDGGYGENHYARMPAALVEVAFMDKQSPDNEALHDENFKKLAAEAVFLGICDYYEVSCVPDTTETVVEVTGPTTVGVGQVFTTSVVVRNAGEPGIFGGQFRLDFDAVYLQGGSLQPGADLGPDLIVPTKSIDNAAGQVSLGVSRSGDVPNVTGDVVLGTVSFTAARPVSGTVISLHDVRLGAKGGMVVPFSRTVDLALSVEPGVEVIGQVELEGRGAGNWDGAESLVVGTPHQATAGGDGAFRIPGPEGGTFDIRADAAGYLPAICRDVSLVRPTTALSNPARLLAGDVNDDGRIDVEDAAAIGMDFGRGGAGLVGDLDDDGQVNIFDLILLAANFGQEAQDWDCHPGPA